MTYGQEQYSITEIYQKYGTSGAPYFAGEDNETVPSFQNSYGRKATRFHATYEEAEQRTIQLALYKDFYKETMAVPFVAGRKADIEICRSSGNTTVEALMHDGKALQSATSHFFGSGFPEEAFGIQYIDKDNQLKNVYETSWGLSTRSIGALIMVHGDDDGLVIPPHCTS